MDNVLNCLWNIGYILDNKMDKNDSKVETMRKLLGEAMDQLDHDGYFGEDPTRWFYIPRKIEPKRFHCVADTPDGKHFEAEFDKENDAGAWCYLHVVMHNASTTFYPVEKKGE